MAIIQTKSSNFDVRKYPQQYRYNDGSGYYNSFELTMASSHVEYDVLAHISRV